MDTGYREPEPFQYDPSYYDLSNWRPINFNQAVHMEILAELHRIVEELDKINVRLSVLDGIKIPAWIKK